MAIVYKTALKDSNLKVYDKLRQAARKYHLFFNAGTLAYFLKRSLFRTIAVAYHNKKPVGVAIIIDNPWENSFGGLSEAKHPVVEVYVKSTVRGRGIGSRLVKRCHKTSGYKKIQGVYWSSQATTFYKKLKLTDAWNNDYYT